MLFTNKSKYLIVKFVNFCFAKKLPIQKNGLYDLIFLSC